MAHLVQKMLNVAEASCALLVFARRRLLAMAHRPVLLDTHVFQGYAQTSMGRRVRCIRIAGMVISAPQAFAR